MRFTLKHARDIRWEDFPKIEHPIHTHWHPGQATYEQLRQGELFAVHLFGNAFSPVVRWDNGTGQWVVTVFDFDQVLKWRLESIIQSMAIKYHRSGGRPPEYAQRDHAVSETKEPANPPAAKTGKREPLDARAPMLAPVSTSSNVAEVLPTSIATGWVEIEILDEDNQPVIQHDLEVKLADGRVIKTQSDAKGLIHLKDIPAGDIEIQKIS